MNPDVLMFGTGRFLRGFACDLLGPERRVVMVQSRGSARRDAINRAGGAMPLAVRGRRGGAVVDERRVLRNVTRCLDASGDADELLRLGASPDLRLVISNTTEAGLLAEEPSPDPAERPPSTLAGRLALLLKARHDDPAARERVLVVLPCELVPENGRVLAGRIDALAERWRFPAAFARWRRRHAPILNTLVDRIVTEPATPEEAAELFGPGHDPDRLAAVAEPFALWAIEKPPTEPGGDDAAPGLNETLHALAERDGVTLVDDAGAVGERKLRLLNGAHTACAALALQAGFGLVRDVAEDRTDAGPFLRAVLLDELLPALDARRPDPANARFAEDVLERFANPFLRHRWADIAVNSTAKAAQRLVPTAREAIERGVRAPALFAGLAGVLTLHRPDGTPADTRVEDPGADAIRAAWASAASAVGEEPERPRPRAHAEALAQAAVAHDVFGPLAAWPRDHRETFTRRLAEGLAAITRDDGRVGFPSR